MKISLTLDLSKQVQEVTFTQNLQKLEYPSLFLMTVPRKKKYIFSWTFKKYFKSPLKK